MAKRVLVKPMITEKSEMISESQGKYTFVVAKDANKIEIKKAIEAMYSVSVNAVNTIIVPSKARNRMTRAGYLRGRTTSYKKAIVTLQPGDAIEFFEDI